MPTMEKKRTMDEVLAILQEKWPKGAKYVHRDRQWLWYCGPSLQDYPKVRKFLGREGLGFSYCSRGHRMPDGNVGSWGHNCGHPIRKTRKTRSAAPKRKTEEDDLLKQLKELGL